MSRFLMACIACLACLNPHNLSAQSENPLGADFELVVQHGHTDGVNNLIFVDDGRFLLSSSKDGHIKVWDVAEGLLLRSIPAHRGYITSIVLLPDNRHILTASADDTAAVFDFNTGERLGTTIEHSYSPTIALSSDGTWFASGDASGKIRIWSLPDCRLLKTHVPKARMQTYSIFLSPDGTRIALYSGDSWGNEKGFRVIDAASGEILMLIDCKDFENAWFSADSTRLVTAMTAKDDDLPENISRVRAFDARTLEPTGELARLAYSADCSQDQKTLAVVPYVDGKVQQIIEFYGFGDFSPQGDFKAKPYLCSARLSSLDGWLCIMCRAHENFFLEEDYTTYIYDLPSGKKLTKYEQGHKEKTIYATDICKAKDLLAMGESSGCINLRTITSENPDRKLESGGTYWGTIAVDQDEKLLAAGTWGAHVSIWSLETMGKLGSFQAHDRDLKVMEIGPDGRTLYTGSSDETVKAWHLPEGKLKHTFTNQEKEIMAIAVNPANDRLCVTTRAFKAYLYDLTSNSLIHTQDKIVADVILPSADGKLFGLYNHDNGVGLALIDSQTGALKEERYKFHYNGIAYFGFDNQFQFAAGLGCGEHSALKVWNADTQRLFNVYDAGTKTGHSFALHHTGTRLAMGYTFDCGIEAWDFKTGKWINEFVGHSGMVEALRFTHSGKHLISASTDGTIRIWEVETGRNITLIEEGEEWLAFADNGYFDSSANGGRLVPIVGNLRAYGIDQFATLLNRPDLMLASMGLGSQAAIDHYAQQHARRLKKLGLDENIKVTDMHVPKSRIRSAEVKGKQADLAFELSDEKYPLIRYNLYVNDVPIFGALGREVAGQRINAAETIELGRGRNKIEVSCMNSQGAESYRALTFADYDEPAPGDLYYVGFGVSDYSDDSLDLGYAHQDALDLAEALQNMTSEFGRIHVRTYVDDEVTPACIDAAKEFLSRGRVDDTVVVFIAGHGMHAAGERAGYYYLTHNADLDDIPGTCAPFERIEDLLQGIAPRSKLLLIDTCESGELEDDMEARYMACADSRGVRARTSRGIAQVARIKRPERKRTHILERNRYIYNDLARRSGAIVFSSSRGNEFSYEKDELRNGLFTEELLNGFSGRADADGNGSITTDELRAYVIKAVSELSGDLQHPAVDRDNIFQKFAFPVIR
ncbi:MAG: caspase family protein [Planctomycetes bacterium]|nr:caspase family protein [Planctomycetota bacterium]